MSVTSSTKTNTRSSRNPFPTLCAEFQGQSDLNGFALLIYTQGEIFFSTAILNQGLPAGDELP